MSRPFSLSSTNVFDETMQNITPTNICGQNVIVSQEQHRKIFDHLVGSITKAPTIPSYLPQCLPTSNPCYSNQQAQNNLFIPNSSYLDASNLQSPPNCVFFDQPFNSQTPCQSQLNQLTRLGSFGQNMQPQIALSPQVAFDPSASYQPNYGQLQQNYLDTQPIPRTILFTFPPKNEQQLQKNYNFSQQPPIDHVSQWKFHANQDTSTIDLNNETPAVGLKSIQVTYEDKECQCNIAATTKSVSFDDSKEKKPKQVCCSCSDSSLLEKPSKKQSKETNSLPSSATDISDEEPDSSLLKKPCKKQSRKTKSLPPPVADTSDEEQD